MLLFIFSSMKSRSHTLAEQYDKMRLWLWEQSCFKVLRQPSIFLLHGSSNVIWECVYVCTLVHLHRVGGWGGCRYWLCVHTCPISTQSVWQASVAITTPPQVAFLSHQPVSCVLSVGVFLSQHGRTTNSRSVVHCGGRHWAGNSANTSDKCFIDAQLSPHDFVMLNQNIQLILWKVNGKVCSRWA